MSTTTENVNIVAPVSDELTTNNSQSIEDNTEYDEYEDDEDWFDCAYCEGDRGYPSMDYMCADCYWDYDSLQKQPRRIFFSQSTANMTDERKAEILGWLEDARRERDEFEAKLDEGIARIKRMLKGEVPPAASEATTTTQATITETTATTQATATTTTTNENKEKTE